MEFNDLASVSGKPGLYRVLSPTRSGVILETLDEAKKKLIANMNTKVSVLADISIYTNDEEGSRPLKAVMQKIHEEFKGDTGLAGNADPDELKSFLKFILPEFDEERVYASDIKKLVNWYHLIAKNFPELLTAELETKEETAEVEATATPEPAKKATKKPAAKKAPATKKK